MISRKGLILDSRKESWKNFVLERRRARRPVTRLLGKFKSRGTPVEQSWEEVEEAKKRKLPFERWFLARHARNRIDDVSRLKFGGNDPWIFFVSSLRSSSRLDSLDAFEAIASNINLEERTGWGEEIEVGAECRKIWWPDVYERWERERETGRAFWPRRNDRMGFLSTDPLGSCYRFVFQTRGWNRNTLRILEPNVVAREEQRKRRDTRLMPYGTKVSRN